MYSVSKTFGHGLGLSCCFRQWRAESHCRFLHGYAIAVTLVVESNTLDVNNWCFDFGRFKAIRKLVEETFDHRLILAADDPQKDLLIHLAVKGVAKTTILPAVGCEAFATYIHTLAAPVIQEASNGRAVLRSVTVREHESNSATYTLPLPE